MQRGFTLIEFAIALAVAGLVMIITLPRLGGLLDGIAVERAAAQLTNGLAVARNAAVMRARRVKLSIAADSLRLDQWARDGWESFRRWPGPEQLGVSVAVSNPDIVFGPLGMGWGAANTRIVLERGAGRAIITTSRVGRVKRW